MVKKIAASLGITPTATGAVSVSGDIDPRAFRVLFGARVRKVNPRPPRGADSGSPGGPLSGPLSVPEPLQPYVESITVAPPHLRMNRCE